MSSSRDKKRNVTQADIAARLKISRSTVASVLCDLPTARISEAIRAKVRKTAKEMGYSPNRHAQIMSKGSTGMIGIINFGQGQHVYSQRLSHAVRGLHAEGFEAMVQDVFWFVDRGGTVCSRMLDMRVEGVILLAPNLWFTQRHLDRLLDAGVPVVALGGDHLRGIPCFLSDKKAAFEMLTRHVLELGRRRLTLLVGKDSSQKRNSHSWHQFQAEIGFRHALRAFGDKSAHGQVHTLFQALNPNLDIESSYDVGARGMAEILQKSLLPDAVLCSNDDWALGAMRVCMEADVRVPHDIAITGCENEPAGGAGLLPLTTVAPPAEELARRAVETLLTALRSGHRPEPKLTALPGELIVRRSCGADRSSPPDSLSPTTQPQTTAKTQ